jgi:hypothetical protein
MEDTPQHVRQRCIELACAYGSTHDAVDRARAYADFVLGTRDAEIIGAARGLVAKVRSYNPVTGLPS